MDGFTAHILPAERAKASFDVDELRQIITKGKDKAIAQYAPLFDTLPFNDQDQDDLLSYEDGFKRKIDRVTAAFKIVRENPDFMIA